MFSSTECAAERDGTHHQLQLIHEIVGQQSVPQDPAAVQQATEIWEQVRADTPDDVNLYNNAGLEYAAIDDHETVLTWLTQGLRLAMASGDPEDLVEQLADLRDESLSELGRRVSGGYRRRPVPCAMRRRRTVTGLPD